MAFSCGEESACSSGTWAPSGWSSPSSQSLASLEGPGGTPLANLAAQGKEGRKAAASRQAQPSERMAYGKGAGEVHRVPW